MSSQKPPAGNCRGFFRFLTVFVPKWQLSGSNERDRVGQFGITFALMWDCHSDWSERLRHASAMANDREQSAQLNKKIKQLGTANLQNEPTPRYENSLGLIDRLGLVSAHKC